MASVLKKIALGLGKSAAGIVLLFIVFAGYGYFAERSARMKASEMCASINPGQNPVNLRERAIADGASEDQTRWITVEGLDTLFIAYVGLPPFSRHVCLVQAKDGIVVSARRARLD